MGLQICREVAPLLADGREPSLAIFIDYTLDWAISRYERNPAKFRGAFKEYVERRRRGPR